MGETKMMSASAGETQDTERFSPDMSMSTSRMVYMADLLLELRDMASVEGHTTLAGILALAHSEAISKAR